MRGSAWCGWEGAALLHSTELPADPHTAKGSPCALRAADPTSPQLAGPAGSEGHSAAQRGRRRVQDPTAVPGLSSTPKPPAMIVWGLLSLLLFTAACGTPVGDQHEDIQVQENFEAERVMNGSLWGAKGRGKISSVFLQEKRAIMPMPGWAGQALAVGHSLGATEEVPPSGWPHPGKPQAGQLQSEHQGSWVLCNVCRSACRIPVGCRLPGRSPIAHTLSPARLHRALQVCPGRGLTGAHGGCQPDASSPASTVREPRKILLC